MQLNINVSEEDYLQYNIYHAEHAPNYKGTLIALGLLVPVVCLALTYFAIQRVSPLLWGATAVIASVVWMLTMPWRYRKIVKKQVKRLTQKNNEFVGQFSLSLLDNHILYEGNSERIEVGYNRLAKVIQDKQYIYLFLGSLSAFIIPPSTFETKEQAQAFLQILQEKCGQAVFV